MRIHQKGGGHSDVPIEKIDSITFVDNGDVTRCESELFGEWLWGSIEAGYYELLTFNEDKTYTGYDNYFSYGFDAMTYGWYMQMGSMLTLQSNGFGYNRRHNWFILGLTDNALDVIDLNVTYTITVYATKTDYDNSDVVIGTLCWIDATPVANEDISVNVAEVKAMPVLIQSHGNILSIEGPAAGTPIIVYDLGGRMVGQAYAESITTNIATTLQNGQTAVVRIGERSIKVLMR